MVSEFPGLEFLPVSSYIIGENRNLMPGENR